MSKRQKTGGRKAGRAVVAAMPSPQAQDAEPKPYELTPADKAALETYKRGRAKIGPRLKVAGNAVTVDHPDRALGHFAMLKAIGSSDSDFLNGLLKQVVNAGWQGPNADENEINFLLSVVKGVEPQHPIEAMLALQMGAVHNATMTYEPTPRPCRDNSATGQHPDRLNRVPARTLAAQVEALKRYRSSGEQKMTVQHVHVAEGGQAIVGNVEHHDPGGRGNRKIGRSTPCSWICARHRDATPNRRGAGYSAERQQFGGVTSAGCMGPLAGPPRRAIGDALKHGGFAAERALRALRKEVRALAQMARETMAAIE